jgi:hypothetical protein
MLPTQFLNDIRYRNVRGFDFAPKKPGDVGHDLHVDVFGMKQNLLDRIVSAYLKERVIVIIPFTNRALWRVESSSPCPTTSGPRSRRDRARVRRD